MKIITILGARPQFIKAAVVSSALAETAARELLLHTGQHYDATMSDIFFKELGLKPPAHHLGIGGLSHGAMTGRMIERIEDILLSETPDWVLVYGDTNSTLAGALAAAKLKIPVAHVEAGMRSFNRAMPEEINRVVTDHVATLQLVTSEAPKRLLAQEGITQGVHVVGDVMYDAKVLYADAAHRTGLRERLDLHAKGYGVVTLHREENTDDLVRLKNIVDALSEISRRLPLVLPIHPRTRKTLANAQFALDTKRIKVIEPLGYFEFHNLLADSALVLTDSGGVQKEAFYHGAPCVTMRDETEWTETVQHGWNSLSGADRDRIVSAALGAIDHPPKGTPPHIYGDGHAGKRIAELLTKP